MEEVKSIYKGIVAELDKRGLAWEFFTNGMEKDYNFGIALIEELGLDRKTYLRDNVKNSQDLIDRISSYRAVIASRMHANIIATSLDVPSVGLVWNDKMNLFAETVGCEDRYLSGAVLLDPALIVDKMEQAIAEGYDVEQIDNMKLLTEKTLRNIVRGAKGSGGSFGRMYRRLRRGAVRVARSLLPSK